VFWLDGAPSGVFPAITPVVAVCAVTFDFVRPLCRQHEHHHVRVRLRRSRRYPTFPFAVFRVQLQQIIHSRFRLRRRFWYATYAHRHMPEAIPSIRRQTESTRPAPAPPITRRNPLAHNSPPYEPYLHFFTRPQTTMERGPSQSPWGHCHVVLPAADSLSPGGMVSVRSPSGILQLYFTPQSAWAPLPRRCREKMRTQSYHPLFSRRSYLQILASFRLYGRLLTASGQSGVTPATRSSAPATVPSQPKNRITAYTLPARPLPQSPQHAVASVLPHASLAFSTGLLVLWFILRRRLFCQISRLGGKIFS